jgi:hypothetical protein
MDHQQSKESYHHRKRSSNSSSTTSSSGLLHYAYTRQRPASPPQAVVTVGGHTLIAPNSTLARAIVMGNEISGEHGSEDEANVRDVTGRLATSSLGSSQPRYAPSIASSSPNRHYQQPRPVSNLTVLLNQHNIGGAQYGSDSSGSPNRNREHSSSSVHSTQVDEADSASGPAPAPPLGTSAPNIVARSGSLLPPSQFARQHSAATQLSTDKVRR